MDSKNNLQLSQRLKLVVISWLESVSIHGIGNLVRSKYFLVKIIWFFLILGSAGYCCFTIFQNVDDYLSYPVVTEINSVSKLPIHFPAVTICTDYPSNITVTERRFYADIFFSLTPSHISSYPPKDCLSFNKVGDSGISAKNISATNKFLDLTIHCTRCDSILLFVHNATINSFPDEQQGVRIPTGEYFFLLH